MLQASLLVSLLFILHGGPGGAAPAPTMVETRIGPLTTYMDWPERNRHIGEGFPRAGNSFYVDPMLTTTLKVHATGYSLDSQFLSWYFSRDEVAEFRRGRPRHAIITNLRRWRTSKGIGLGSSRGDVLRAYGRPTDVTKSDGEVIVDYHAKGRLARFILRRETVTSINLGNDSPPGVRW